MVNYIKDFTIVILHIIHLVKRRNAVFQSISLIILDYLISFILLRLVISIKNIYVRISFLYNTEKRSNGDRGWWYGFSQTTTPPENNEEFECY